MMIWDWDNYINTAHNLIKLALRTYSIVCFSCFSCRKKTGLTNQESVKTLISHLPIYFFGSHSFQTFMKSLCFQLYLYILFSRSIYSYNWLDCKCFLSFGVLGLNFTCRLWISHITLIWKIYVLSEQLVKTVKSSATQE
jgi:hypothetical protein